VTTERFTLALDRPEAQFRDQPQNVRFLGKVKPEANRIGGKGTARQQCSFDRAFFPSLIHCFTAPAPAVEATTFSANRAMFVTTKPMCG
jgi:hypothetical protein